MKTSKVFTEITNTGGITTRLKPEFAHNPEHFSSCHFLKVDECLNSLMFQLSCGGKCYLSYESVKYSCNIITRH